MSYFNCYSAAIYFTHHGNLSFLVLFVVLFYAQGINYQSNSQKELEIISEQLPVLHVRPQSGQKVLLVETIRRAMYVRRQQKAEHRHGCILIDSPSNIDESED